MLQEDLVREGRSQVRLPKGGAGRVRDALAARQGLAHRAHQAGRHRPHDPQRRRRLRPRRRTVHLPVERLRSVAQGESQGSRGRPRHQGRRARRPRQADGVRPRRRGGRLLGGARRAGAGGGGDTGRLADRKLQGRAQAGAGVGRLRLAQHDRGCVRRHARAVDARLEGRLHRGQRGGGLCVGWQGGDGGREEGRHGDGSQVHRRPAQGRARHKGERGGGARALQVALQVVEARRHAGRLLDGRPQRQRRAGDRAGLRRRPRKGHVGLLLRRERGRGRRRLRQDGDVPHRGLRARTSRPGDLRAVLRRRLVHRQVHVPLERTRGDAPLLLAREGLDDRRAGRGRAARQADGRQPRRAGDAGARDDGQGAAPLGAAVWRQAGGAQRRARLGLQEQGRRGLVRRGWRGALPRQGLRRRGQHEGGAGCRGGHQPQLWRLLRAAHAGGGLPVGRQRRQRDGEGDGAGGLRRPQAGPQATGGCRGGGAGRILGGARREGRVPFELRPSRAGPARTALPLLERDGRLQGGAARAFLAVRPRGGGRVPPRRRQRRLRVGRIRGERTREGHGGGDGRVVRGVGGVLGRHGRAHGQVGLRAAHLHLALPRLGRVPGEGLSRPLRGEAGQGDGGAGGGAGGGGGGARSLRRRKGGRRREGRGRARLQGLVGGAGRRPV
mmetsp:Transcript_37497/g.124237  ORF Transcript_37497/g.124237 Transcript_37497/m.124237 type:complete len:668 (+) Transcript_37497:370-2373(+)